MTITFTAKGTTLNDTKVLKDDRKAFALMLKRELGLV